MNKTVEKIAGVLHDQRQIGHGWDREVAQAIYDQVVKPMEEARQEKRGCLLAKSGRGDCEHFVGLPKEFKYPDTVDEYGRPHNWCEICWDKHRLEELQAENTRLRKALEEVLEYIDDTDDCSLKIKSIVDQALKGEDNGTNKT